MNHRGPKQEMEEISPIARSPIFNLSRTSSMSECGSSPGIVNNLRTAGLSPELRKLLVQPRNVTEADELRQLLNETINLTRAAVERGLIKRSTSMPDMMINLIEPIERNTFYRPFRRQNSDSLSLFMKGLNLAAWEVDDINEVFGLPKTPSRERIGVLNMDLLGGVVVSGVAPAGELHDEIVLQKTPDCESVEVLKTISLEESNVVPQVNTSEQHSVTKGSIKAWLRKRELSPNMETPGQKAIKVGENSPGSSGVRKRILYHSPSVGEGG